MSLIVKAGKKAKKLVKKIITPAEKHYVRYTRRIERIKTDDRVCAMTFDDGPMDMPAAPDRFGGRAMTDVLLDTLKKYDAHGTFDVIGFTGDNYPDEAGALGSAAWGGVKFDHYPEFGCDERGGAELTFHFGQAALAFERDELEVGRGRNGNFADGHFLVLLGDGGRDERGRDGAGGLRNRHFGGNFICGFGFFMFFGSFFVIFSDF